MTTLVDSCVLFLAMVDPGNAGSIAADEVQKVASADEIAELRELLDHTWVLVAASLVFLMQAGFMCVESGLCRAKNSINVCIKNLQTFNLGDDIFDRRLWLDVWS